MNARKRGAGGKAPLRAKKDRGVTCFRSKYFFRDRSKQQQRMGKKKKGKIETPVPSRKDHRARADSLINSGETLVIGSRPRLRGRGNLYDKPTAGG